MELLSDLEYFNLKLKEINGCEKKVSECGFRELKKFLNKEWFHRIRISAQETYLNNNELPFCGEYFTYRWLFEEGQFNEINRLLEELYSLNPKKNMIRNKVKDITTSKWKANMCEAFEIAVICKLLKDKVLKDIEPLYGSNSKKKADALVKIDSREILIEVTAFQNENDYFSKDIAGNINKIIRKVISKYNDQIINSDKPSAIFMMRPSFMDQIQINWAVNELFSESIYSLKNLSAIAFINGYTLNTAVCYFNPNCCYPFTEKEKDYVGSFCAIDSNLKELVDRGLLSDNFMS